MISRKTTVALAAAALTAGSLCWAGASASASAASTTSASGAASGNDLTPAVQALMKAQEPLDAEADRIHAVLTPDTAAGGYTNTQVDAATGTVTVYWHGPLSAPVAKEIAAAGKRGVRVVVKPARYTWAQMEAEAKRLIAGNSQLAATAGVKIAQVGPVFDGSGLQAEVARPTTGTTPMAAVTGDIAAAAKRAPLLASSMPLTVTAGSFAMETNREGDTAPFYSGGVIVNTSNNHACTAGFAVHNGGATYLLTADHCGFGNYHSGPSSNVAIGQTAKEAGWLDTQTIHGSSNGNMWYGTAAWTSTGSQLTEPVKGVHRAAYGDLVCSSGAYNGTTCNEKITNLGLYVSDETDGGSSISDQFQIDQTNHYSISGAGDSGGPVFVFGGGGVLAVGGLSTNAYQQDPAACYGARASKCSWRAYYSDVQDSLNALDGGYSVTTG